MLRREDNYDPDEQEVRRRVINQVEADPVESPVYQDPEPAPPPPSPAYQPPDMPRSAGPSPTPASDPNSQQSLAAINASLGFPNFNPQTGLNNDGSRVVGPNGDPSHQTPTPQPTQYGQAAGFDQSRLNNPNDHEIKYEYGRYAQDHPGLVGTALRDAFASDPKVRALFPGIQTQGADQMRANPNDPWQDVIGDVGGQNRLQFMNAGGPAQAAGSGAGAASGTSFRGTTAAPTQYNLGSQIQSSQQAGSFWDANFTNQLRQMLMQRLQAAGQPVDPNDPNIANPLSAARDEATRHSDKERTQLAERLYAQGGLNTNAITQQIQQSGEETALGMGTLRAQLMSRELQSRRDELKDLMQMALASGDAESARNIQMQMAMLDAQLKREGMDLDAGKYSAYLNQQAALEGLRG